MKQKFDVTGMTCSACSAHVEKSVRKLDGVVEVNVNLLQNSMSVEYDENNPAEGERYQSLAEGIPELLDSFALIDSENGAAVRNWSEDLEAVETFQKSISFDRQGLSFTIPEGNSEQKRQ